MENNIINRLQEIGSTAIRPVFLSLLLVLSSFSGAADLDFNDPFYLDQWYLGGEPFNVGGGFGIGFKRFHETAMVQSKQSVTFIMSTGVYAEHEDIIGSLWINEDEIPNNGIDDDNNGYIDDIHGINSYLGTGYLQEPKGPYLSTSLY
ncbi:MAG: hypothetical protein HRT35_30885, partial [Algicola sp.]|nr:hypothetical protein [Algicola sp.]